MRVLTSGTVSLTLLDLIFFVRVGLAHQTAIWEGQWAENAQSGLSELCSTIRKTALVKGNQVNVFITFPLHLDNGKDISKELFEGEVCNFGEIKKLLRYLPANEAGWEIFKNSKRSHNEGITVITLGHGTRERTIGIREGKEDDSFKVSYLESLATNRRKSNKIKYISNSCYSANPLSRVNRILARSDLICGLTSTWNQPIHQNGWGPMIFLDQSKSLTDLEKKTNAQPTRDGVRYDDGEWLSSYNYIEEWFDKNRGDLKKKIELEGQVF